MSGGSDVSGHFGPSPSAPGAASPVLSAHRGLGASHRHRRARSGRQGERQPQEPAGSGREAAVRRGCWRPGLVPLHRAAPAPRGRAGPGRAVTTCRCRPACPGPSVGGARRQVSVPGFGPVCSRSCATLTEQVASRYQHSSNGEVNGTARKHPWVPAAPRCQGPVHTAVCHP